MVRKSVKPEVIRCAVIGYGGAFNMGKGHANWINAAPGMETVAACDLDPVRMEAAKVDFPGIRTYTSVDALLKDDEVELCVVILPHNVHSEVAVKCSNAGKHVVVEKPMCITTTQATAMIEAAKKAGKMLTIFHNRRQDGDYLAIKEVINKGMIGEVFQIEACGGGYDRPGAWWRSNKEISGGAMYDWGAHFIDWMLNLIPSEIENVTGFFQKKVWHHVTNEDHTHAIIRFKNGASADLQISSLARAPKPRWRILRTKGGILEDGSVKNGFRLYTEVDGVVISGEVRNKDTDWAAYYRNISEHLHKGADLDVKPEEARRVIAVLEAAGKSAKSGISEKPAYP